MLPIIELLFAALIVDVPGEISFIRLKQAAHGSGSVSFGSDGIVFTIPSESFQSVAFDRAAWRAQKPVTILNTPAIFVELLVSLIVPREGHWWPGSWQSYTWHVLTYPIYALPAWIYIGFALDAMIRRRHIRRWNVILSVVLVLTCASLFCVCRFGMPAAEREGQERLSWFIDGFAMWTVLFFIPIAGWFRQKKQQTLVQNEPLPS